MSYIFFKFSCRLGKLIEEGSTEISRYDILYFRIIEKPDEHLFIILLKSLII